jgi:hypothetical protein
MASQMHARHELAKSVFLLGVLLLARVKSVNDLTLFCRLGSKTQSIHLSIHPSRLILLSTRQDIDKEKHREFSRTLKAILFIL